MINRVPNRNIVLQLIDKNGKGLRFESRSMKNPNGFYISFSINKNQEKEPNESTVIIYNLSEDNRRELDKKYYYIILNAGYNNDEKLLSLGEILEVKHIFDTNSIKTTISFNDGSQKYSNSAISKTFSSGTKIKTIIDEISKSMGYKDPFIADIDDNLEISNATTISGKSSEILKDFCDKAGVKFSIQNDKLYIKKEDSYIPGKTFLINKNTGLIDSVEKKIRKLLKKYKPKRKNLKKTSSAETVENFYKKQYEKDHEVELKCLLQPEIIPGSYVLIESMFVKTYAVVSEVNHYGSNFDNDFYTQLITKTPTSSAKKNNLTQSAITTASSSNGDFVYPINQPRIISSRFGMRWGRPHNGIDIACSSGTTIYASAAGTVEYSGILGQYGNCIIINHGNNIKTRYAHASSLLVSVDEMVTQGQAIGYAGSTGRSTGPHLHFELRLNGVPKDPLTYI